MSNDWLKYTLHVNREQEELFLAELLDSAYTLGWTEPQIEVITTENGYDYVEKEELPIVAYVYEVKTASDEEHVSRLQSFLQPWGDGVKLVATEQVEEATDSWKDAFQPVQVGDWTIAPSWSELASEVPAERTLRIDPGAAFGTGYHGTTQDILKILQRLPLDGKTIVDVGAGSGILSIFCVRQGAAQPVYAIDINPESSYEILHNVQQNGLPESCVRVIIGDASEPDVIAQLPRQADLLFINIGADEDIAMLPVVKHSLAKAGTVIFSGIVEWSRESFEATLRQHGFTVRDEAQSAEWVTLVAQYCSE